MSFRYSKRAYKVLWFLLVLSWATVLLETKDALNVYNPMSRFLMLLGLCTSMTLIFLGILDIIEWRYTRR